MGEVRDLSCVIFQDAMSSLLLRQMTVNSWSGNWAIAALMPHPPPVNCRGFQPAVLAGRRLSPRFGIVLLESGIRIEDRAVPQERALSEELIERLPSRQTVVREVLVPAAEIFDACLQSGSAHPVRSGPPQVPGIADAFVMADRALLDDSSRVFFEKGATHAERRKMRFRANSASDCPLTRFTMSPSRK